MSWILFLAVIGIILICLELFLPGMIAGIAGALCLFAAVILTYHHHGISAGNQAFALVLIVSAGILVLWIVVFPKTRGGKYIITYRDLADSKSADSLEHLLGKTGKSLTPLRPAGTAFIENQRIDVVAESGLIDPENSICVVRVEGNRVVVRKV